MSVKMSLRDRLDWSVDSVGMILLCLLTAVRLRLPSPSPNCFLRVFFPTLFAADLKDFLPLKTSPISGAANSNLSAPMRFAAATTYLRKNGIAVLPITCARAPKPLPSVFLPLYSMEFLLVLKQPSCSIVSVKMNVGDFSKHQNQPNDTDRYKRYFFTRRVSQINVYTMKRIVEQRSKL